MREPLEPRHMAGQGSRECGGLPDVAERDEGSEIQR